MHQWPALLHCFVKSALGESRIGEDIAIQDTVGSCVGAGIGPFIRSPGGFSGSRRAKDRREFRGHAGQGVKVDYGTIAEQVDRVRLRTAETRSRPVRADGASHALFIGASEDHVLKTLDQIFLAV